MKVLNIALVTAALTTVAAMGAGTAGAAAPDRSAAPATQSQLREYEGRILSVNRSARTFRLRDSERGTITVKVNRNTRFERLAGFSGLRAGQNRIEVQVRRSNGSWLAREVERSGGGGQHGGGSDDGGGDDNGGGRGRDHAEDD